MGTSDKSVKMLRGKPQEPAPDLHTQNTQKSMTSRTESLLVPKALLSVPATIKASE